MKIRGITRSDLKALAKLDKQVFRDASESQALKVFRYCLDKGVPQACLLAEENGELVGAVFAEKKVTFSPREAGIKSVFVKKTHRRKGIGGMLLRKSLSTLKKMGFKHVSLSVEPKNGVAAALYKKLGFKLFRLVLLKKL